MPVVMLLIAVVLIRGLMWVVARDEATPAIGSLELEADAPHWADARGLLLPAAERAPLDATIDATADENVLPSAR